jgi:signal transduction histidine kinase
MVFYRLKLKRPLAELQSSAARIARGDLDFSVAKSADDELGELCTAFETMRVELFKNKQELWRQMEERKRLNAAFSHDLRNPVTVLKGAAKILQINIVQGNLSEDNSRDTVALISEYTERIENYVEAMSSAQRLEDLNCTKQAGSWRLFMEELKAALSLLRGDTGKQVQFTYEGSGSDIWIDKSIITNTAENLVGNALRYAQNTVSVRLCLNKDYITLSVLNDGPGFSDTILKKVGNRFCVIMLPPKMNISAWDFMYAAYYAKSTAEL